MGGCFPEPSRVPPRRCGPRPPLGPGSWLSEEAAGQANGSREGLREERGGAEFEGRCK